MTLTRMQGCLSLFVILVVILLVNPSFYYNLYNNILGRVFLIIIMVFFAMNNVTLGLLVALIIIIGTNGYFTEGMDNMIPPGALKMNPANVGQIQVNTRSESKKKKNSSKDGIDRISLHETMKAQPSEHTSVSKENFTSANVSAADSGDLKSNTSMFSTAYSNA